MDVEVLPCIGYFPMPDLTDKAVIVIDVLRATSTVITALANGCRVVVPVCGIEEAREIKAGESGVLLGGERRAQRIDGFDLGNSPSDYSPEVVSGKKVVITTTNGTKAIQAAQEASKIWIASLLNADSVTEAVKLFLARHEEIRGLVIICAGTEERFDLPDTICAGMILAGLGSGFSINDLGLAARMMYNISRENIKETLKNSRHGQYMLSIGMECDIDFCALVNIYSVVPVYQHGQITIEKIDG
ncbi:2-phosphosulfolactate phosphatase [Dehalobacter sp. DCM]|uniref:2-phosphosulfolactate phosphatase n=1 Tax=Dehalobacter sp. DCM TaxID=2907827 RepID=UPI003081FCE3|nr:2-phosphosulfolactate phosphatase [Dehalobacter sp. DCM]